MPSRKCIRCRMDLPLAAFSPHKNGRAGLNGACKACEVERLHMRKHGMTTLQKDMIATDSDGCAICGRLDPGSKTWVVDHDRSCCPTEQSCSSCRRGVLCHWCNTSMGYALDNPVFLRRMADYIELGTRLIFGSEPDPLSESESDIRNGVPRTYKTNERTEIGLTDVYLDTAVDVHACIEDSAITEMEQTP